jgi:hypothetical protein
VQFRLTSQYERNIGTGNEIDDYRLTGLKNIFSCSGEVLPLTAAFQWVNSPRMKWLLIFWQPFPFFASWTT